jgi:hypothetical protein
MPASRSSIRTSAAGIFAQTWSIRSRWAPPPLLLEEIGTACFPGNSLQAPFPLPFVAGGTYIVSHGTGVFQGAKGSGTFECTMAAGDQQHCTFSGALTLP